MGGQISASPPPERPPTGTGRRGAVGALRTPLFCCAAAPGGMGRLRLVSASPTRIVIIRDRRRGCLRTAPVLYTWAPAAWPRTGLSTGREGDSLTYLGTGRSQWDPNGCPTRHSYLLHLPPYLGGRPVGARRLCPGGRAQCRGLKGRPRRRSFHFTLFTSPSHARTIAAAPSSTGRSPLAPKSLARPEAPAVMAKGIIPPAAQ